ncbi:hypothetical protein [Polynucleobacter sp. AP-Ainpum-60-G11]|uniref:hypothetical protein n=1 Tax=Polynucleobacter sp. AP-Ainpum-60-G11 TaxID=2576926 RepID=UPI001BFEDF44|nr:hypothetical protein [Polynucleobacter sp. AP-Ainpum-60-G11]QWE27500.1 hypothetical protein FD971_04330 [Polynucleobacter sp. AP-Ainpum-60-G11]
MAIASPKNIRLEMRRHIAGTNMPFTKRRKIEDLLVRAVRYFRIMRSSRHKSSFPRPGNLLVRLPLARGRQDETLLRAYIFSALFRAWMIGFDQYPKINNKGYPATNFVNFADYVLKRIGIGKAEDHLEEFRSYRKKILIASGFKVVRGKVI